ncbi:MFS transporter [Arthrobacter woluwensis]|uniref:MFS transporter n=1 Tax=Arthrobacter woluwensis TaxID=156980 RepID=UPI0021BD66CF|nr:MFS transporter [Arthrobacter woluwensis]
MSLNSSPPAPPPSPRRAWFMLVVLTMLTVIGMTVVLPVMPFIVQEYLPHGDPNLALWVGVLEGMNALCAFLAAPFLGGLSDRVGRRPVIIVASFGAVIGYLVFGFGGSLWILLLGRVIQGVTAGDLPALFAYTADITPAKDRAKRFGLLGALNGIGFMIGPALGGLLSAIDIHLPVFVTAVVALIVAILAIFLLPESLAPENRTPKLALEELHPVKVISDAFRRPGLRGLLLVFALMMIPFAFFTNNFSVLAIDAVGWSAAQIGLLVAVIGVLDVAVQGGLLAVLLPRIGEKKTIIIGILGQGLGCAALVILASVLAQPWLLIAGVLMLGASQGLTQAPLDGLISSSVGDDEQGRVAGALQAVGSAIQMAAPIVAGLLYSGIAHVAPYLLGVLFILAAAVVFSRLRLPRSAHEAPRGEGAVV